jgi:hypothetical protein
MRTVNTNRLVNFLSVIEVVLSIALFVAIALVFLKACAPVPPELDPTATATATQRPTATATRLDPTATATEAPTATATQRPTKTATLIPTATEAPTFTPTATAIPPTATPEKEEKNCVRYVDSVEDLKKLDFYDCKIILRLPAKP